MLTQAKKCMAVQGRGSGCLALVTGIANWVLRLQQEAQIKRRIIKLWTRRVQQLNIGPYMKQSLSMSIFWGGGGGGGVRSPGMQQQVLFIQQTCINICIAFEYATYLHVLAQMT